MLFALAVVLGGSNFLAVRLSNVELQPFWGAGLRFTLAALAFFVLTSVLRLALPRGRVLWQMAGYGVLSIAAFFYALMHWALLRVTAGVATVILALVPLATVLLAAAQRLERFRVRSAVGGAVAVAGIAWLALDLAASRSRLVRCWPCSPRSCASARASSSPSGSSATTPR